MKKALIVVLICVAAAVGMFAWYVRTITMAYRLTLEVRVDGETHIGSGVVANYCGRNVVPLTTAIFACDIRGEAVTVDLGRYGPVFLVLWGKYDPTLLPVEVYKPPHYQTDYWTSVQELTRPRPPLEIPHDALPLLVRFRDLNQPSTAECVDPDDMQASFPPDAQVTLVHATIELVNEPVTTGVIEKWLPWLGLPRQEGGRLLTGAVWHFQALWGQKVCQLRPSFFERKTGRDQHFEWK
jgi:hypothetical protein